jgi:glycosyltransferase involved in cell wall biosynthesis
MVPCSGRWDWHAVRRLRELLDTYEVDVLHAHGYKADVYGCIAAWPHRAIMVSTCHNWPDPSRTMRLYGILDRLALRRFDAVAAASEGVAAILRHAGIDSPMVIANGIEVERFEQRKPALRKEIAVDFDELIGFVGRMVPEKGGEQLLHAAKAVITARPRTAFVFAGDGPSLAEWKALAVRLGISDRVFFLGARQDIAAVYASLDMLVLPSLVEAMPMCLLEALAAGKPVVATRVGSVAKVIVSAESGLLVDPGDVRGLTEAILLLLSDPDRARRMAQNGHDHVLSHYSAKSMASAYLHFYRSTQAGRQHSRLAQWSRQ